jgi:hypothetical protein
VNARCPNLAHRGKTDGSKANIADCAAVGSLSAPKTNGSNSRLAPSRGQNVRYCRDEGNSAKKDTTVTFFENYFGWLPDGGDGSMELMFLLMVVALIVAAALHLRYRRP